MTLNFKVGTFTKPNGDGTVTVTPGFQIKALIVHTAWTITANTAVEGYRLGYGFGSWDGSTIKQCSVSMDAKDNLATSDSGRVYDNDEIIRIRDITSGTTIAVGLLSNITSTQFDIVFSSSDTTQAVFTYEAWGGSDITNVNIVHWASNTTTGDQDITTVGFQGDIAFFIWSLAATDTSTTASHGEVAFGHAVSSSKQGAILLNSEDARNPTDTWRWQRTDRCMLKTASSTGAADAEVSFVSWLSNGFRVNVSDAPATADFACALVIKGGLWDCGAGTTPVAGTPPVTQNVTTTVNPIGAMMYSIGTTALTTVQTHNRLSIGAADNTPTEFMIWMGDKDAVTPSATAAIHRTQIIRIGTENATASSSTTEADANISSFGTAQFTLSWGARDTTAYQYLWVAFATVPINEVVRTLATQTVTLSDSQTRLIAKTRAKVETAITVGETRARLAAKMRPIAAQTITIGTGIAARIKGKVKSLATQTIILSDSRSRLGIKMRPLTIEIIAVSESVARVKTPFGGGPADMSEIATKTYGNKFITKV